MWGALHYQRTNISRALRHPTQDSYLLWVLLKTLLTLVSCTPCGAESFRSFATLVVVLAMAAILMAPLTTCICVLLVCSVMHVIR